MKGKADLPKILWFVIIGLVINPGNTQLMSTKTPVVVSFLRHKTANFQWCLYNPAGNVCLVTLCWLLPRFTPSLARFRWTIWTKCTRLRMCGAGRTCPVRQRPRDKASASMMAIADSSAASTAGVPSCRHTTTPKVGTACDSCCKLSGDYLWQVQSLHMPSLFCLFLSAWHSAAMFLIVNTPSSFCILLYYFFSLSSSSLLSASSPTSSSSSPSTLNASYSLWPLNFRSWHCCHEALTSLFFILLLISSPSANLIKICSVDSYRK